MSDKTPPAPSANTMRRSFEESGNDSGADSHLQIRHDQAEDLSQPHQPPPAQSRPAQLQNVRFEHVSAGEDAQQVIVSTIRESIFGKDVAVEARGTQLLGQMEDCSVQRLSEDRTAVLLGTKDKQGPRNISSYNHNYGAGRRLTEN